MRSYKKATLHAQTNIAHHENWLFAIISIAMEEHANVFQLPNDQRQNTSPTA